MISETRLKGLESVARLGGSPMVHAETLAELVAAARVANSAARVEREEQDVVFAVRRGTFCTGTTHVNRARADLARALRRYTAGEPQAVKP